MEKVFEVDLAQIQLQYARLERHYRSALSYRDPISFLDLAHTLRIWVDMKNAVEELGAQFPHNKLKKQVRKILKNTYFLYTPSEGVDGLDTQISALIYSTRILSPEERTAIYEAGPPDYDIKKLDYKAWLGAIVIATNDTSSSETKGLDISREKLITRVANLLGASHPYGMEKSIELEEKWDRHIQTLAENDVIDGIPFHYYQLIKIAETILERLKPIVDINQDQNLNEKQTYANYQNLLRLAAENYENYNLSLTHKYLMDALRNIDAEENPWEYARVHYLLGTVSIELFKLSVETSYIEEAISCLKKASEIWKDRQFLIDYAVTETHLGNIYQQINKISDALQCWREALKIYVDADKTDEANMLQNLIDQYTK